MNFAQAYFTRLDDQGPNAEFLQSYGARLTYALANQLGAITEFPETDIPYAKNAEMPLLKAVQTMDFINEGDPELDEQLAFLGGFFNQNTEPLLRSQMRVRERMAAYIFILQNALRFPKTFENSFPDVTSFVKGLQISMPKFPLHPALVVGPGFNVADSIENPYYGTHHVTWSLQDSPFAFQVAEMYELYVRRLILDQNDHPEFFKLLQTVLADLVVEKFADRMDMIRYWASNLSFSFAPVVRLFVSYLESPAPFTNSLTVFESRLTAAFVTSLA